MLLTELEKRHWTEKMDLKIKMVENDCFDYLLGYKYEDEFSAHSNTLLIKSAYCICCQHCNTIMNCKYDGNLKSLCGVRLTIFALSESEHDFSCFHHAYMYCSKS